MAAPCIPRQKGATGRNVSRAIQGDEKEPRNRMGQITRHRNRVCTAPTKSFLSFSIAAVLSTEFAGLKHPSVQSLQNV